MSRLIASGIVLLLANTMLAAEPVVGDADKVVLKDLVARVAAWEPAGRTAFDDAFRQQLAGRIKQLSTPELRTAATAQVPEWETAAVWRAKYAELRKDVAEVRGKLGFESAAPEWLVQAVGAERVAWLERLVDVDLWDQSIAIKSGTRNQAVTDEWLRRLANLPHVRSINLQSCEVTGPGLQAVGTLKTLEKVNLTLLPMKDEPGLPFLKDLGRVKVFSLASSQCTGEGFAHLGALTALENLNFHYTPVNDAGLAQISKMTSLTRLEIVHVHFTDAGAPHLARLVNMERLQIGSRDATGASVAPLTKLPKLRELDLHDGQATAEGMQHAGKIPTLQVLRVYGPIGDAGLAEAAGLANLETLLVPNGNVTDAGLASLASLKKLKKLDLQGNKVTPEGVARLKAALPELEVQTSAK